MASRFQAAPLVASPLYPNAIAWSDENLIAVACGHLVTILNPALPFGPRGLITIPISEPYPIGLVKREDLLTGCLLPTALSRDRRPCVRSISWSPLGMASNAGCLLAVCTTEGRVKLYRPPFSDFCAEWIEVIDLSDRLYNYLANTNFEESEIPESEFSHEQTELGCIDDHANVFPNSITRKEYNRRRGVAPNGINKDSETSNREKIHAGCSSHANMSGEQLPKVIDSKSDKRKKKKPESCSLPQITADQYASRSAMLSSVVVAWSPLLCLSSKISLVSQNDSPRRFSLIAVGGKSGNISLWRIDAPQSYSIEHGWLPTSVMLVGLLQAHNSWVTAVNFAFLGSNTNPQVLLASGCSDGSVKIWLGSGEILLDSSESNKTPFFLLKEVIPSDFVPVSVLSIKIPVQAVEKMLLAVGKGSGSFDVWTCDISGCEFSKCGSNDAHDYVVTGLAWAFEGCLYSCGQVDLRHWGLCPFLLAHELPDVFLSCLGLAISPGNLVVAMVRNLDVEQLDHMYEARAQKAIVEFFWIGGQQWDPLSKTSLELASESVFGFSEKELVYWESSILWSLKKIEDLQKPLVMWDIIAALLAFKKFIPKYADHILARYLSMTFLGSHINLSINEILMRISDNLAKVASRLLHLLNIICRCLVLSDLKSDEINSKVELEEPTSTAEEQQSLWMELLFKSEKELRERLVGLSLSACSTESFSRPGNWHPVGSAQMVQWVELNRDHIKDQLKFLASEVQKNKRRLSSIEYEVEEQCSYCSASAPFTSAEVAFCQGSESSDKDVQNHKLARCTVSMQVCPATPLWSCKCCTRQISKLAPETLFTMSEYPEDFKPLMESCKLAEMSKPLCPFCGILLQRLQPDFLLSASPV
ncbi:uncharacterized protein LOC8269545 isoform X3 [Ricinus communis]|uniref:uncharacterized protein LOC8269545 isoform X3 n=1 Tax=Ricinus communis TaxID=3988 RepID=UPI00201AE98A|nr:uncharacterized protein LOC8269545 isoform X3 [Ricinus communis]